MNDWYLINVDNSLIEFDKHISIFVFFRKVESSVSKLSNKDFKFCISNWEIIDDEFIIDGVLTESYVVGFYSLSLLSHYY